MLGLRLDEPMPVAPVAASLDTDALARLERLGLARIDRFEPDHPGAAVTLTHRGRLLGDAVTADLLA
jgi:coproporphyrinogen III oxidase-like Fe-S oxidoreductase